MTSAAWRSGASSLTPRSSTTDGLVARWSAMSIGVGVDRDDHQVVGVGVVDDLGIGRRRQLHVDDVDRVVAGVTELCGHRGR